MPHPDDYLTHHGYGFNVKDHAYYSADPDDVLGWETVEAIYQGHAEGFWRDAQLVAQERGFRGMYSEGRSGGWAVLDPQLDPDYMTGLQRYNLARRLAVMERELRESMAYWREQFLAEVAERVRLELAEPAEREHWAARDTVTV